jgi:hypothetical protein
LNGTDLDNKLVKVTTPTERNLIELTYDLYVSTLKCSERLLMESFLNERKLRETLREVEVGGKEIDQFLEQFSFVRNLCEYERDIQIMFLYFDAVTLRNFRNERNLVGFDSRLVLSDSQARQALSFILQNDLLRPSGTTRK